MAVIWTAYHGEPAHELLGTLEDVLTNFTDRDDTVERAIVSTATARVEFHGDIVLDLGGEADSGTIHVIKVFDGDTLIAKGTAYHLDIDEIGLAFDAAAMGDFGAFEDLLFNLPLSFFSSGDDDTFRDGNASSVFHGHAGDDRFETNGGADDVFGGGGDDVVFGGNGKNDLSGNAGDDILLGGPDKNILKGGIGDDYLGTGGDNSKMTGGGGDDGFGLGAEAVVKVTDFQTAKDRFVLSPESFDVSMGDLLAAEFHVGNAAHDASDRIIYNDQTGALFYDEDGNGATAKVKFAELDASLNLSADNFFSGYIVI